MALISNSDIGADQIYQCVIQLIDKCWNDAKYFTKEELEKYRKAHKNQQKRMGIYNNTK